MIMFGTEKSKQQDYYVPLHISINMMRYKGLTIYEKRPINTTALQ